MQNQLAERKVITYVISGNKPVDTLIDLGTHAADPHLPFTITHLRHGNAEITAGGDDIAVLVLILSEGQIVERNSRGVWSHRVSKAGLLTVTDPDEVTKFSVRGHANIAPLLIPMTALAEAAGSSRRPRVQARFIESERRLAQGAIRALVALHEGAGSDRLLLSSILLHLAPALVERPTTGSDRAVGGLSRRQLRRVEELIEASVFAPVASSPSLGDLAAEANLSLHHFAREFRRTVGVSPYAYTLRRRLERALRLVINTNLPLARIGAISGFPSAAHFSDRFHREMGVAPGALRRAAQA